MLKKRIEKKKSTFIHKWFNLQFEINKIQRKNSARKRLEKQEKDQMQHCPKMFFEKIFIHIRNTNKVAKVLIKRS